MKVVTIFEASNGNLFTAKFDNCDQDALVFLKDKWTDAEFLRSFFLEHNDDYNRFYGSKRIGAKVSEAISLARKLRMRLSECSDMGVEKLDELFNSLHNDEQNEEFYELQFLKAKGRERKSYLRIYALRYKGGYVVSGRLLNSLKRCKTDHILN